MGLQERRILQEIKEETARAEKELQHKIGVNVSLTVDEQSFPLDDAQVLNEFFLRKVYGLTSVLDAMSEICKDDLGKDAIKDSVQSIQIVNTAKHHLDEGSRSVELKGGDLKIFCAFNQSADNLYKPEPLRKEIESLL